MSLRVGATLLLLAACAHGVAPARLPQPPADPRQRRAAEEAACSAGTYPAWLDDDALNRALDLDRRESQASVANDAFRGGMYVTQPPPPAKPGPHATALEEDRRAFDFTCAASKRRVP